MNAGAVVRGRDDFDRPGIECGRNGRSHVRGAVVAIAQARHGAAVESNDIDGAIKSASRLRHHCVSRYQNGATDDDRALYLRSFNNLLIDSALSLANE